MNYFFSSIKTLSYWRYAIFSAPAVGTALAITGSLFLLLEMLDFFGMYTRDRYSGYAIFVVLAFAVLATVFTRRPVTRVSYRIPKKDFSYEVVIGDLLDASAPNIVVSTNTTFDTDLGGGLIHPESVQGKFTNKYFGGRTDDLDEQISESLNGIPFADHPEGRGKKRRYPVGTVARVSAHGKTFYLTAMSELNAAGNAYSDVGMIDTALQKLWKYLADSGELGDVAIALLGTGRGRVKLPRKKIAERIAQSFADASQERVFSNRLTIFVYPPDASRFGVNLFEIRDYLTQSLHV